MQWPCSAKYNQYLGLVSVLIAVDVIGAPLLVSYLLAWVPALGRALRPRLADHASLRLPVACASPTSLRCACGPRCQIAALLFRNRSRIRRQDPQFARVYGVLFASYSPEGTFLHAPLVSCSTQDRGLFAIACSVLLGASRPVPSVSLPLFCGSHTALCCGVNTHRHRCPHESAVVVVVHAARC